jgi:hypothetical protein
VKRGECGAVSERGLVIGAAAARAGGGDDSAELAFGGRRKPGG